MTKCKGDSCLVGGTGKYAGELFYSYLIIDCFILVSIQDNYEVFVDGSYLVPLYNNGVMVQNPWTETVVLRERPYHQDRLQWSSQIIRKVSLFPLDDNGNDKHFIPIDFDSPPSNCSVHLPFYPLVDGTVAIKGTNDAVWYVKVLNTDWQNKQADVQWFNEVRPGHLRVTNQTDNIYYRSILYKVTIRRGRYGFELV